MKSQSRKLFNGVAAIVGLALISSGSLVAQTPPAAQSQVMNTTTSDTEEAAKLPSDQLDSLVAPIALYPDPLLAQTLAASTYPLEIIQLEQWMDRNKNLQGKALADAVAKQPWDPSVQGLVEFPDVVQRMAGNIQWTTDLGNAFLAQQSDVMDAVQRMRAKAQGTGNLKTGAQQVVKTETVPSGKQVIEIQQANPDVIYVPSYDPTVVYGPPPPAYPYYPYTYPGYVPGTALMWGAGIALGAAAWGAWGGHWGNCNWNGGNINVNNNYNFNKNVNRNVNRGQGNNWQHNPQHRGNAPYGDRGTANKFGGNNRQQPGGGNRPGGGAGAGNRPGAGAGAGNRPSGGAGAGNRPGGGAGAGNRPGGGAGAGNRPGGGASAGNRPGGGAGASNRPGGGAGAKPSTRPAGGTAKNQVGNRSASSRPSSASRGGGGFGGGSSGNYARASSNRGGHSMGGGGMSRGGGGGRGGGGRGGGGGGGRRR